MFLWLVFRHCYLYWRVRVEFVNGQPMGYSEISDINDLYRRGSVVVRVGHEYVEFTRSSCPILRE